ncbi:MAG: OmpH family outer membrane protein [Gammaproteobacteria bacterium]|nr:OmpH family outer membrane protein [Gammaproteobacteria bacterium]
MQKIHRILLILALAVAGLVATTAWAEVKIAVVDVQKAILRSEQAKTYMLQIQNEFKGEEDEIRTLQSDAAALLERLQKDGEVMSDSEKRKLQLKIEDKNSDFLYLRKKLQRQIDDRQQELFAGIDQKVQKAIEELVMSDDFDLILPRQAALYVADLYDITRKVTEKLNLMDKPKAQ